MASELSLKWREITDRILDWQDNPEAYDEEGMRRPDSSTLLMAFSIACALSSHVSPPERVVQTVRGGVSFEWPGKRTVKVEPWELGCVLR